MLSLRVRAHPWRLESQIFRGDTRFRNHTKEPALNCLIFISRVPSIARVLAMDSDGLSSPPPEMYSELPPSSAPDPTPTANATPRRQIADALTIDAAAESNEPEGASRRRRRPRQVNGEVPMVKDAVGESVAESFETFLKT